MTKRNTLLSLSLFLTLSCAAQINTPSDIVVNANDETNGGLVPRRLIATRDGGFLQAGSDGPDGYITKTGSCGQLLWTKKYRFGDETDLNSVVELPSGEIAAAGACLNCAPADSAQKALVLLTDANGVALRDTTFGYANFNAQANDLLVTAAGKIAVGVHADFSGFLTPSDAVLAVLNTQLQTELWKPLHHFYLDDCAALLQTPDGGFVVAGYSVPAFFAPRQAQLFRTDAAGNVVWKYTSPHLEGEFSDVAQAADGRIVAFGDRKVDDVVKRDVYLAVFDGNTGALLSEKTYGSPADDSGKSLEKTETGYLAGAIYGEPSQQGNSARNWVFRLDEQFDLVDEHFRDGYLFAHFLINSVPLSSDGRSFAYHSRLIFFSSHRVQFFKRTIPGDRAVFDLAPQHFQLTPRNLATNKGVVTFQGALPNPGIYDKMQLDVLRNGAPWLTLYDETPQAFEFKPEIPAELAEYTFRLSGVKNQTLHTEAEACDLVAGDAYLIQGQSNAVAGLPYDPDNDIDHAYRHHQTPFVRNFGLKYDGDTQYAWRKESGFDSDYADNLSGQWGLILGKSIADSFGIPVAIFNGAISGIPIDEMMPDPADHNNPQTSYGRFLQRVQASGLRDHLRAILMFQGESNAAGGFWDSADKYYQKFEKLDNAWKQDFPALQQRYLFQIRPGLYWAGATLLTCLQVAEAHRRIAENLPGWQIMSTTGMNHDSSHYYYSNGYERAGHDIFRLVAHDLYGAPQTPDMYPPTPETLRSPYCNPTKIYLQLRHTGDTYQWTPGRESDFRLEGATDVTVTGGQIKGNILELSLSGYPGPGFTGLSYTAHPGGSEAPVKNTNGIGMLMFYNLPVHLTGPIAISDIVIKGDNGSGNGSVSFAVTGGEAPYNYLWNTGDTTATLNNLVAGDYTVTITDAYQCALVFLPTIPMLVATSTPTGDLEVGLFPNPCGDYLNLRIPELPAGGMFRIRISDLMGREVMPAFAPVEGINRVGIAALPPGTYIVRLDENGIPRWKGVLSKI